MKGGETFGGSQEEVPGVGFNFSGGPGGYWAGWGEKINSKLGMEIESNNWGLGGHISPVGC